MNVLNLSQDTLRQRRNLVITSALLIFISLANVSFGDTVNFLGATLSIGKPEIIHQGLLIFLVYFLWRFYQYFVTDKAYNELCSQFRNHMQANTSIRIVRAICKPKSLKGLSGDEYTYKALKLDGMLTYSIEAKSNIGFDPVIGKNEEIIFVEKISVLRLEIGRLLSAIVFLFRARILTDYFVPYIMVMYATYLQFA